MKARVFIGNILIALISAFFAVLIYSNYFQNEFSNSTVEDGNRAKNFDLINDLNSVNHKAKYETSNKEFYDFTIAAEKSVHAVVHVTSKYNLEGDYYARNPIYELLFGDGYNRQPSVSFGSGVIISDDGYIVTNNHVIEKSDEIQVVLNDKRTFTAKVVGTDPGTDLALLKIEASNLPFIPFGDSDQLKIGEWVLAVGNPFNLTSTVTAGIVSAKARNINILRDQQYAIESFIQTDAAVNQGNSGGALVNLSGELVGINSAIISSSGSYSGYSFAIPINIAKKVVADIIKYGEVQRAILGVEIREVINSDMEDFKLDKIEGVLITKVRDDGAAKDAGIKKGDIIIDVNKVKVNSTAELTEQISQFRPGEIVYVTIKRENKRKPFEVVLRNMHGNTQVVKTDEFLSILGASFRKLNNNDKRRLGIDSGLLITELKDGALKDAGIKKDFIITSIQDNKINSIDDLKKELSQAGIGSNIELNVTFPGSKYIYVYRIKLEHKK